MVTIEPHSRPAAARWLSLMMLGLAATLLTACSTPQKYSDGPTLWEMVETSNIERVNGGTTYVYRTLPRAGYFLPYYPGYLSHPPRLLGGFYTYPYFSLYYPYYGYRPYYVWSCPVSPRFEHPVVADPFSRPGQPLYTAGPAPFVASSVSLSPLYTGSGNSDPFAVLEPQYSRDGTMPFTSNSGQVLTRSQPIASLSELGSASKIQVDQNKVVRGFQRPDPVRSINTGHQRLAPGFGTSTSGPARPSTRPTRSFSRPSVTPRTGPSGVASIRPRTER